MGSDYAAIKGENLRRYGTDIGRIGPMLLADRYADRTHFIFELLQNAEDALKRRRGIEGPRSVSLTLTNRDLRVSHLGVPFTESDVRGICGIGESTKLGDLTAIGRFGIGFKSVYAITHSPEIHSGDEHFAIDTFVWPRAIIPIETELGGTLFILPFRAEDSSAYDDVASGFRSLGVRTLLFLREIDAISWRIVGGSSGTYLRGEPILLAQNVRKVELMGQESHAAEIADETWLVFSRGVRTPEGQNAGFVEIAFALAPREGDTQVLAVARVPDSFLVVFFPTIVSTNLGFLVQGPYKTTPSRDNVPPLDPWNRYLVKETARLVVESLRELRDMDLLDAETLRTLPLDRAKFTQGSMFAPLFEEVRKALIAEPLLPRFGGGHVAAAQAKLARTREVRELLDPPQLAELFKGNPELYWLTENITPDRTPELQQYLSRELQVADVYPATILSLLSNAFLEAQSDEWIAKLYVFLHGQPALWREGRLDDKPVVRLENGSHVPPRIGGQPQAFLPGSALTGFPTVRKAVCEREGVRAFLSDLGLTKPDPVDDVVRHILPRFGRARIEVLETDYEEYIRRITIAFKTDSIAQREKLLTALRETPFVTARDTGSHRVVWARPEETYLATQRLKDLFKGVSGVLIVDDSRRYLRGDDVREVLEACGVARTLNPIRTESRFTGIQLAEMRKRAGWPKSSWGDDVQDVTLRGLEPLLDQLQSLQLNEAVKKAALLWEALSDVVERRGTGTFVSTYKWFFSQWREHKFDASFVDLLNRREWVPDGGSALKRPDFVVFENLSPPWAPSPFLLSKIRFKPRVIEELAREAGIEPVVLDLLKALGLTTGEQLKARLGIVEEVSREPKDLTLEGPLGKPPGDVPEPIPSPEDDQEELVPGRSGGTDASGEARPSMGPGGASPQTERSGFPQSLRHESPETGGADTDKKPSETTRSRPFFSYVAVHPDEEEYDPEGLDPQTRLDLEEKAIALIISREPKLRRTPTSNRGFDLLEVGSDGSPVRWVEVKAMTGNLQGRPVTLTRAQFGSAQEHGEAYWLYAVEQVGSTQACIVKIQDPAGKARTFTFDHGWRHVAVIDPEPSQTIDPEI